MSVSPPQKISSPRRTNTILYNSQDLEILIDKIQSVHETISDKVEALRKVAEVLVWGELHDDLIFEYFCEKNILLILIKMLTTPNSPREIKMQLLQSFCILIQNLTKPTYTYYLFSNYHFNHVINQPLEDDDDEEFLALYMCLLKSLGMLINQHTLFFFFNQAGDSFPLYVEAAKFVCHTDSMIRTHARTLILKIISVSDSVSHQFFTKRSSFFTHLACRLREEWCTIDTMLRQKKCGLQDCKPLNPLLFVEAEDLLLFIQDILDLGFPTISRVLVDRLLRYAIIPTLIKPLLPPPPSRPTSSIAPIPTSSSIPPIESPSASLLRVASSSATQLLNFAASHTLAALPGNWVPEKEQVDRLFGTTPDTSKKDDSLAFDPVLALYLLNQLLTEIRNVTLSGSLLCLFCNRLLADIVIGILSTLPSLPESYKLIRNAPSTCCGMPDKSMPQETLRRPQYIQDALVTVHGRPNPFFFYFRSLPALVTSYSAPPTVFSSLIDQARAYSASAPVSPRPRDEQSLPDSVILLACGLCSRLLSHQNISIVSSEVVAITWNDDGRLKVSASLLFHSFDGGREDEDVSGNGSLNSSKLHCALKRFTSRDRSRGLLVRLLRHAIDHARDPKLRIVTLRSICLLILDICLGIGKATWQESTTLRSNVESLVDDLYSRACQALKAVLKSDDSDVFLDLLWDELENQQRCSPVDFDVVCRDTSVLLPLQLTPWSQPLSPSTSSSVRSSTTGSSLSPPKVLLSNRKVASVQRRRSQSAHRHDSRQGRQSVLAEPRNGLASQFHRKGALASSQRLASGEGGTQNIWRWPVTKDERHRRTIQFWIVCRRLRNDLKVEWLEGCDRPWLFAPTDTNPLAAPITPAEIGHVDEPITTTGTATKSGSPAWNAEGSVVKDQLLRIEARNLIRCHVMTAYKLEVRYVLDSPCNLILVSPSNSKPGLAVVRTVCGLAHANAMADRHDTCRLLVNLRLPSGLSELQLIFKDSKRCLLAKKLIMEGRARSRAVLLSRMQDVIGFTPR